MLQFHVGAFYHRFSGLFIYSFPWFVWFVISIGSIANVAFDNMGGNASLGFAKSFSATYFCRACINSKEKTQHLTVDVPSSHRNRSNYGDALNVIKNSTSVNLKETFGINSNCLLNGLKYFHILDNWNFDIMHDLCEGVVPDLLECVFHHLIDSAVITEQGLKNLIASHDYGILNRHSVPSELRIGKKNNNQSASSSKCLMEHIPLILYTYRNHPKLKEIWKCVTTMLNIMKICYSNTISDTVLSNLEEAVDCHLKNFMECFKKPLKPKQHLLTHYATSIRKVGPLVHNSSLRFEMKHKQVKDTIKNSNNFQNVPMSVANRMQIQTTFHESYIDLKEHSAPKRINDEFVQQFGYLLHTLGNININDVQFVKNVKFNSNYYESGLILKNQQHFEEIRKILVFEGEFYFVCTRYNNTHYNHFLNCIKIEEAVPNQWSLLKHNDLEYPKTHDKIKLENSIFILANCLEVESNLC